MNLFKKAQLLS